MFISLLSTSFFFTKYIYYFIIFKLYLINLQTTIYRIAEASVVIYERLREELRTTEKQQPNERSERGERERRFLER